MNNPLTFGDLVLYLAGLLVDQVKVVPAVALGHPDELVGRVKILRKALLRVVDERLRLLVDHRPSLAGRSVDRDDAQNLVPALIEQEAEAAGIGRPVDVFDAPRVFEKRVGDRDLLAVADSEQMRLGDGDLIAGLQVIVGNQLGLKLIGGRRLDKTHFATIAFPQSHRDEGLRVGRPIDAGLVAVDFRTFEADWMGFAFGLVAEQEVVIADQDRPVAVWRAFTPG